MIEDAKDISVEFEIDKIELLYASRKRELIQRNLTIRKHTIKPSQLVRYLSFFLDSKLSYKEHVQKMVVAAQQAFFYLQRLSNTQRGLSMQATRQLYIACVASIANYSIQAWWGRTRGGKSLLSYYQTLQNTALRQILGAFKGSLIRAIEIEASILPLELRAKKLCQQYSLRLKSFSSNHPVRQALVRLRRVKGIQTHLSRLACRMNKYSSVEEILTTLASPWSKPTTAYATVSIAKASKEVAANNHKQWLDSLGQTTTTPILVYTDGSKKDEMAAASYCQLS